MGTAVKTPIARCLTASSPNERVSRPSILTRQTQVMAPIPTDAEGNLYQRSNPGLHNKVRSTNADERDEGSPTLSVRGQSGPEDKPRARTVRSPGFSRETPLMETAIETKDTALHLIGLVANEDGEPRVHLLLEVARPLLCVLRQPLPSRERRPEGSSSTRTRGKQINTKHSTARHLMLDDYIEKLPCWRTGAQEVACRNR